MRPRQSRFVTFGMLLLAMIVLGAGTVIGVFYFAGDDSELGNMFKMGGGNDQASRTVTAPLANRTAASFEMLAGAQSVHVTIGELGDQLYKISTPDDAGIKPSPVIRDDAVQLQVTRDGDGTGGEIDVVLAAAVRWQLRFSGYAEQQVLDLSDGQISGVEMVAGMRRAEIDLPRPTGTVPLKINGAVESLVLRSPDGNPIRVNVGGDIGTVIAGARTLRNITAGSTITPRDWKTANRYDVTTAAAITSLNVENVAD